MIHKILRNALYLGAFMGAFFVTFYVMKSALGNTLSDFAGGFLYSAVSLFTAVALTSKVVKPWIPKTY